jgi:cGMP-dependent protein kinase
MLDEKGYLRIIDFGFSKKVPYTKTDAHGEVKVYAKTYTLCGTPGTFFDLTIAAGF